MFIRLIVAATTNPKLLHLHRLSPLVPFLQVVREGLFHLDPPKNAQEQHLVFWVIPKEEIKFSSSFYLLSWYAWLSHRPNETNQALEYRDTMLEGWICRYLGTKESVSWCLTLSPVGPMLPATPGSPYRDKKCFLSFFALKKCFVSFY